MYRDLGNLGESIFETWCHHEGPTANRVTYDKKGWDYYVEFEGYGDNCRADDVPLDLRPAEISCLIQIKSLDHTKKYCDVRLANWKRMAQSPLPAAFLVLEFDRQAAPQRAYLVPVGRDLIARTLKRLREFDPDDINTTKFNRCTMRLKWSSEYQLTSCSGSAFVDAMMEFIGQDSKSFFEKKREWLDSVGYEEGWGRATFQITSEVDDLVDFAIGLKPELPARMTEWVDLRFGIERNRTVLGDENSTFKIDSFNPIEPIYLEFIQRDGSASCKFRCQCFAPGRIFPFIETKKWKVRYCSDFIDFVHEFDTDKVHFDFSRAFENEVPLSILNEIVTLFRLLREAPEYGMKIRVDFPESGIAEYEVSSEPMELNSDVAVEDLIAVVEPCVTLAHEAKISAHVPVVLNDLIHQQEKISSFRDLMKGSRGGGLIRVSVDVENPSKLPLRMGFPMLVSIRLGKWVTVAAFIIYGKVEILSDETRNGTRKVEIGFQNGRIDFVCVDKRQKSAKPFCVKKLFVKCVEVLEGLGVVPLLKENVSNSIYGEDDG
ncbi:hypothetical protein FRC91_16395 [Bradymonadales bacterium TMQ1]|nr:hypothetical protein FRC91_16395 [Bradymonadales bacterium TMQ1]